MKLRYLLPILFCLPITAWAQGAKYQAGTAKPTTDIFGELPVCLGPTNVQAVTCGSDGCVCTSPAEKEATFAEMDVTLYGSIGATYTDVLDLPDGTRAVVFDNQTNGDVDISFNGTTTHFSLKAGDTLSLNLSQFGLVTTAHVWVKRGTTTPTSGVFNISSFK